MFSGCSALESADFSNLDISSVEDLSAMFYDCKSLKDVDLSTLDTSSVKDMEALFYSCTSLTSLDLSGFDTSNVMSIGNMFKWCMSLKELDVSSFDTSKVTASERMIHMFKGCTSLERVVFGKKTNPFGTLPSNEVRGHTDWFSERERAWFTADEIGESRLGIPDTYTR